LRGACRADLVIRGWNRGTQQVVAAREGGVGLHKSGKARKKTQKTTPTRKKTPKKVHKKEQKKKVSA